MGSPHTQRSKELAESPWLNLNAKVVQSARRSHDLASEIASSETQADLIPSSHLTACQSMTQAQQVLLVWPHLRDFEQKLLDLACRMGVARLVLVMSCFSHWLATVKRRGAMTFAVEAGYQPGKWKAAFAGALVCGIFGPATRASTQAACKT